MLGRGTASFWKDIGPVVFVLAPLILYLLPYAWLCGDNSICLYRNLTGKSCFGCGMTRALAAMLHLRWQEAWEYNRLIVAVAPGLAFVWLRNTYHLTHAWLRKPSSGWFK